MELVGGLFQPVLGACSVPKPRAGLVDWAGAPKDRKMNAAVLTEYGREVKHKHIDLPTELTGTEVLIEVHAASISPMDIKMKNGEMKKDVALSLPSVVGHDFSGMVRKVGRDVRGFKPGDGVFGRQPADRLAAGRGGSLSEWCVVDAKDIVAKPDCVSHEEASACPTSGMTAWAALTIGGLVRTATTTSSSKKVIVIGGSGGVGSFAVQMAKAYFEVKTLLVVCSKSHKDLVTKLGADEFLDYTDSRWKDRSGRFRNFDLVIDCVGLDDYWEVFGRQVLGPSGKYISLVPLRSEVAVATAKKLTLKEQQAGKRPDEDDLGERLEKGASERILKAKSGLLSLVGDLMSGFRVLNHAKDVGGEADLRSLRDLLSEGHVKPAVDSVHELRDAFKAYDVVERGHAGGKVVVRTRKPWERESVQQLDLPQGSPPGEGSRRGIVIPGRADADVGPSAGAAAKKKGLAGMGVSAVPMSSLGKVEGSTPRGVGLHGSRDRARGERKKIELVLSKSVQEEEGSDLPDGWESAYDPDGEIYYYNRSLNVSQYEHPAEDAAAAAAAAAAPAASSGVIEAPASNVPLPADVMIDDGGRMSQPDVAVARTSKKADGPDVKSVSLKSQARRERGMEKVQEQQSEEEEEFDPEYMDVQEEKVVSSHRSRGKKPAPIGQQQGGKTDEREGPKCGLGLTLKERSDGEYYIKRMEKGGPCEASGEVKIGDILVSVDDVAVRGLPYAGLVDLVLGEEGTRATLVLRDDVLREIRTVQVRRFPIDPQALADNERLHRQHAERIVSGGASAEGGRGRRRGSREEEQRQRELAERIISETGVKRRSASRGREADEKRLAEERGREEERLREIEAQRERDEEFKQEQRRMRELGRLKLEEEERKAMSAVARAAKEERRRVEEEEEAMRRAAAAAARHGSQTPLAESPPRPHGQSPPGGDGSAPRPSPMPKVLYAQPVADDIPGRETINRMQQQMLGTGGDTFSSAGSSRSKTPRGVADTVVARGQKTPRGKSVDPGAADAEASSVREAALAHAQRLREEQVNIEQQQMLLAMAQHNLENQIAKDKSRSPRQSHHQTPQPQLEQQQNLAAAASASSSAAPSRRRGTSPAPPPLLGQSTTPRRQRGKSPAPPKLLQIPAQLAAYTQHAASSPPDGGSVPPPGWEAAQAGVVRYPQYPEVPVENLTSQGYTEDFNDDSELYDM